MEARTFFIINIIICTLAFLINLLAAFILWKRSSLKPFQIMLLNVVLFNAIYALNEMSTAVIFFTYGELFQNRKFMSFVNLKAELLAHTICLFIVFMTMQRLLAVTKPLKYAVYVTTVKTRIMAAAIYCTVASVLIIFSALIWKTHIDASIIDRVLSVLFITESGFIALCYIVIICKITGSGIHRSSIISSQNRRVFNIAIIVSTSFLLSYTPIAFVLVLNINSITIFQTVLLMVWIDSFINPITIIFNTNYILGSTKKTIRRVFSNKDPQEIKIRGEESETNNTNINVSTSKY